MRTQHPDPRPTAPGATAPRPVGQRTARRAHPLAVLALAPLLLASCTDDVAANCPPLAHPEVLTVTAAANPCAARKGESTALLALRVVRTISTPMTEVGR